MQAHHHGPVRHSLSEEVMHPVCKNLQSAASSISHQLSQLWHPSLSITISWKNTLWDFLPPFLKSRFVDFLKGSDNCRQNTHQLSLTFELLFYGLFNLFHNKGWWDVIESCQEKKQEMFPDAFLLPLCLQLLKSHSDLEWPGCEDLVAWQDCNQGKLIQALHSSSKSTSSSTLWSPNVAIYLMRMTCPN